MTTVAFKDGVFVADTGSVRNNNEYNGKVVKLYRNKYWAYGISGDAFAFERIKKAFSSKIVKTVKKEEAGDFTVLAYSYATKHLYIVSPTFDLLPILEDHFAIGSGGTYCMSAMDAGASLEEAVTIACKYDIYSFLPLQKMEV